MEHVYDSYIHCSGCAACAYVCPKNAIQLEEDEHGYRYPSIDQEKCIDCGKCASVCHFIHPLDRNTIKKCLAGQNRNEKQLRASSSGGVFSALAERFLAEGGAVCGAVMVFREGGPRVKHILLDRVEELPILQGSKYVQSCMDEIYAAIGEKLEEGRKVLFSGSPCQVAAVKSVFSRKADNLFCIDIVCHGVPSERLFRDYIALEEKKTGTQISSFVFRDKHKGWGLNGYYLAKDRDEEKQVFFGPNDSSYYRYFLDGETYRTSCYSCPYANTDRVGDITIGDYWGIERFNPELLTNHGGDLKKEQGISCVLVNSDKGETLMRPAKQCLQTYPVNLEDVVVVNTQLREPAKHSEKREKLLSVYTKKGYCGIDRLYQQERLKKRVMRRISRILPSGVKRIIKSLLS